MRTDDDVFDAEVLVGSGWCATPRDYSSLRVLTFNRDGQGEALYGYGQRIYAQVRFQYELREGGLLHLRYLPSPASVSHEAFEPIPGSDQKSIAYTLARGEFRGVESIVGWAFVCKWLLTLQESPWPAELTFPHPIPTAFYGYLSYEPRRSK